MNYNVEDIVVYQLYGASYVGRIRRKLTSGRVVANVSGQETVIGMGAIIKHANPKRTEEFIIDEMKKEIK